MPFELSQVSIRRAELLDCAGMARVHIDTWRTTYQGIVPQKVLDGLSYGPREERWEQILSTPKPGECNFVALDEHRNVIGFSGGGAERDGIPEFSGELYAVYLVKNSQRKGIGRLLVGAVASDLLAQGKSSMLVWVLAANPACKFYERLGGVLVSEKQIEIGGASLREVAYGWKDITPLVP